MHFNFIFVKFFDMIRGSIHKLSVIENFWIHTMSNRVESCRIKPTLSVIILTGINFERACAQQMSLFCPHCRLNSNFSIYLIEHNWINCGISLNPGINGDWWKILNSSFQFDVHAPQSFCENAYVLLCFSRNDRTRKLPNSMHAWRRRSLGPSESRTWIWQRRIGQCSSVWFGVDLFFILPSSSEGTGFECWSGLQ